METLVMLRLIGLCAKSDFNLPMVSLSEIYVYSENGIVEAVEK